MIKNVVFDIGGVMVGFRWRDHMKEIGAEGEIFDRTANATVFSGFWDEIDLGNLPLSEIIDRFVALDPGVEDYIRSFFEDRTALVYEFDYSAALVDSVKKAGYGMYFLSNFGKEQFEALYGKLGFFGREDGKVVSYEAHCLKPGDEIYHILLDRYNLSPEECVFLDDTPENVEAAKKLGFNAIVFESLDQALGELESMGVVLDLKKT
ncbi:MAG: HAD family phosphatase [Lachnospiraceae bacterium]|nr:HAD family phosphatase [Lachnospiraceae bacterium]